MKILFSVVHYWNPDGGGKHQSLRPDPQPRIDALKQQLISLRRLGLNQSYLHLADRKAYPANTDFRSDISIHIITDGSNHVLDYLPQTFSNSYSKVECTPSNPLLLGFEVHKHLEKCLDEDFDWFCYLEDDLVIYDPYFLQKILWFENVCGADSVLLPQRVEFALEPNQVDRFYIDGPIDNQELCKLVSPGPVRLINSPAGSAAIQPALNPHAGCFFISRRQLEYWVSQPHWLDYDVSFVSALESAATLGLAKTFSIFKPCLSTAGWLEIQHYGNNFHTLLKKEM